MSLITCAKCPLILTWAEIDFNERLAGRRDPKKMLCRKHGREDFEKKLAQVKARQKQLHQQAAE